MMTQSSGLAADGDKCARLLGWRRVAPDDEDEWNAADLARHEQSAARLECLDVAGNGEQEEAVLPVALCAHELVRELLGVKEELRCRVERRARLVCQPTRRAAHRLEHLRHGQGDDLERDV